MRETSDHDAPWGSAGEVLVLPLELQKATRELAAACERRSCDVTAGARVTVWAASGVAPACDGGMAPARSLEPLLAQRMDRTLAVDPVEVIIEPQSAPAAADRSKPIHFGEGFRLRCAEGRQLYLAHDAEGKLFWRRHTGGLAQLPENTRFTAHGGELGTSLHLGRVSSILRLSSPPREEESESEESSDPDSDDDKVVAMRRRQLRAARLDAAKAAKAAESEPICTLPPGGRALFSRLADTAGVASGNPASIGEVVLLPPIPAPSPPSAPRGKA